MQQLNKVSTLETVAFVRGTRIRQYVTFAARQTHRLTRQPYLVAEVIPSFFFIKSCLISPPSLADMHTLYSKTRAPLHILPVRFRRIPNAPHYPCKILLQYLLHRLITTCANTGVICRAYSASSHSPLSSL